MEKRYCQGQQEWDDVFLLAEQEEQQHQQQRLRLLADSRWAATLSAEAAVCIPGSTNARMSDTDSAQTSEAGRYRFAVAMIPITIFLGTQDPWSRKTYGYMELKRGHCVPICRLLRHGFS